MKWLDMTPEQLDSMASDLQDRAVQGLSGAPLEVAILFDRTGT